MATGGLRGYPPPMRARLPRTVIRLRGEGMAGWLDGLLTNNVQADAPTFAALLSPQGKILADMVVTPDSGGFLLDTPEAMGAGLLQRLRMYVLRAPITVEDVSATHDVEAVWDDGAADEAAEGQPDPRHPSLGVRRIGPVEESGNLSDNLAAYDRHRLSLGVPDSQFDFGPGEMFPHDAAMDELHGLDLKKGCFVGQEVVSRMARLSTVRKRIRTVLLQGGAEAGDTLEAGARRVGVILHVNGDMASVLVRLDRLEGAATGLTVNGAPASVMGGPNG